MFFYSLFLNQGPSENIFSDGLLTSHFNNRKQKKETTKTYRLGLSRLLI